MTPTTLVLAKAPVAGRVKTRLCPPVTPEAAAELADCLLRDTLDLARSAGGALRLVLAGEWAAPEGTCVWPQGEGDLGERLDRAFRTAFAQGGGPVVAIGTDCPGLRPSDFAAARVALESADLVLGPAPDGGYWLIGLRASPPDRLWDDIAWSTERTREQTLWSAERCGLSVALLRSLSDLDTPADLPSLEEAGPRACAWWERWRGSS